MENANAFKIVSILKDWGLRDEKRYHKAFAVNKSALRKRKNCSVQRWQSIQIQDSASIFSQGRRAPWSWPPEDSHYLWNTAFTAAINSRLELVSKNCSVNIVPVCFSLTSPI